MCSFSYHDLSLSRPQITSASLTCLHLSYVSPRQRAQKTLELLGIGCRDKLPWQLSREKALDVRTDANVQITYDIREWDYGDYEGITSEEIKRRREKEGLPAWDIWKDGCPGGE